MANFKNNSLTLDYSIKISLLRLYLLYVVNHLCKTLTVTDAKCFLVNNDKLLQKQKSCQSKTPEKHLKVLKLVNLSSRRFQPKCNKKVKKVIH